MKAQDIILHLMRWLPEYTDEFSSGVTPVSVVVSGTTVTMTFSAAHGIVDGGIVSIKDALVENPIDTIDDSGDNVVFTTILDHDITEGWTGTVNLTSVLTPSVNGDYTLISSENRRTFEIASFPDVLATDVVLNEPKEYVNINGLYNVTLISPTQISFELSQAFPVDPVIKTNSVNVLNAIRISGGSEIERLIKHYDEQPVKKLWGFVVLGDSTVNKDRNVADDPPLQQGGLNDWGILMMQNFNFFVFVPSKNDDGYVTATGRPSRDLIEDIRPELYKAILGTEFDTGFTGRPSSVTVPTGDNLYKDLDAYIVHQFQFQQVAYVSSADVIEKSPTVALRNISIDYLDVWNDTDNILMEADINLDENPS